MRTTIKRITKKPKTSPDDIVKALVDWTEGRSGADARQHGGNHYKAVPKELEHWNVVAALGWDYYIGTATKYLWRLGRKDDPVVELDKAMHYLVKKKELILAERAANKK